MKIWPVIKRLGQRLFKVRKKSGLGEWAEEQFKKLARLGQPLVVMSAGR